MAHTFIRQAEEKHGARLREECRHIFETAGIPSHDHLHHERVWENAAQLLERLYSAGMVTGSSIAEKAIIAAFFHDTGLTVNRGMDHGRESRRICDSFLETLSLDAADRREILDAVEKHDDKDYTLQSDPSSLAAIISVADDMDAFGETGIGRYEEIYAMRGIAASEMPGMIVENVLSRLRHLESTYGIFPDLAEAMRVKAETVISYFRDRTR
ncbi:MAG: HD domain-containing protein [Bacteroidales bacterium]|jgi:HD superfamily phosphodiesterase|nr:HD domain-containing protein [Bacteroidales bacterium]